MAEMSAFTERDKYHLRLQLIDNHGKVIDHIDYPPRDWMELQQAFSQRKRKMEERGR